MKHRVIIMRCDRYEAEAIAGIIREGMETLEVVPSGRVLLKPNAVIAHPEVFPHAFTRKEFLDGAIAATKARAGDAAEIAVGERSGITIPTRFSFDNAGYGEVLKKHRVKAHYFDETRQVPVSIAGEATLRDKLYVPKPIADCDFLINLPKFKAHPWCKLTLSLKNFIGLQDDRHRLVDHNLFLEHKIADLQQVIQPKFIAIDGITAGQKMMLTPTPFHLGAIVMGTNSCAVDTVGCHMVHMDPGDLTHLRFASARGFGPMSLDDIEVLGDFPLGEVRERSEGFAFCNERVDDYFADDPNLRCTVGRFPEAHSREYCWGGCPGALQEAVHIVKAATPKEYSEMRKIHYVVGQVDAPLEEREGETVIFAGDCTRWSGTLSGEPVKIKSRYVTASKVDEDKTPSNDMLLKTLRTVLRCLRVRKKPFLRAVGCPVPVGDHVHYLSFLGRIPNPNFDRRILFEINIAYLKMRFMRLWHRIFG
jgi:uncharacterized protein (DUF362 family)